MTRIMPAIALALSILPAPALAQRCPGTANAPDMQPLPTVVSYSVTRESGPPAERTKEGHEASVVGGHPVDGRVLFDIRLSRDVPGDCPIRFELIDPRDPAPTRAPGIGAEVLRAVSLEELRGALDVTTDGTNRLVVMLRSRPAFSQRRHALSFRLGGPAAGQPTHPFTLVREPNGQVALTTSAATIPGGSVNQLEVTATLPTTIDAAALAEREMVRFTVVPPDAGGFRGIGRTATSDEGDEQIATTLSPMRAAMKFVPSAVTQTTAVTIKAELFDTQVSRQITITPDPNSCRPEVSYEVEAGAVVVTIVNRGRTACPRFNIVTHDWSGQRPLGPATVEPLSPTSGPGPAGGRRDVLAPRGLAPIKPLPALPVRNDDAFEGRYRISAVRPSVGSQFSVTLLTSSNSLPPITLSPLVFTPADVAAFRGP